jgi:DNA topoisomerase IA
MAKNLVIVESPRGKIEKFLGSDYQVQVMGISSTPSKEIGVDVENGLNQNTKFLQTKALVTKLKVWQKKLKWFG